MKPVTFSLGGAGPPVLFAHANGYPPLSYRRLTDRLLDHCELRAMEHRPLWAGREPPQKLRWELFADDLIHAVREQYRQPVWLLGHSMGGTISVLAAARAPELFAGLLLLDPVILPRRLELAMRLAGETRRKSNPLVKRALRRPEQFDSLEAAFSFYRPKRAFRNLSDEALWDYVRASKVHREDGGVQLRFSAAWEAAIYASVPLVRPALKRLSLPTLALRGRDSDTLLPEVFVRWRRWQPDAVLQEVTGGHLFPLEHPAETAYALIAFLATHASAED